MIPREESYTRPFVGESPTCRQQRAAKKSGSVLDKGAAAQLADRLLQFLLRIHDDRAVPGDRLLDRLPRHQQEADAALAGLHRDLVAAVEQHQRAIADQLAQQDLFAADLLLGQNSERLRGGAKAAVAFEDVGEGVA